MRNDLFTEQVESYFIEINLGRDIFWGKSITNWEQAKSLKLEPPAPLSILFHKV